MLTPLKRASRDVVQRYLAGVRSAADSQKDPILFSDDDAPIGIRDPRADNFRGFVAEPLPERMLFPAMIGDA